MVKNRIHALRKIQMEGTVFERAHELVLAESEQKRIADEKLGDKMKTLSQALDPKVLQEIQVENTWDPFDTAPILRRSGYEFQSLKSKVDAFLQDLQKVEHKVTFKKVCEKALELLSAEGDSPVLQTALERLVCYDNGKKILVEAKTSPDGSRVSRRHYRKYTINHNAELKRALAETKHKRPDLWMMLPKLLEHKEKMRAAMGEKPIDPKPNDSKPNESDDDEN